MAAPTAVGTRPGASVPAIGDRARWGLVALLIATLLGQFESFVIVVALPSIQQDLGASFGETQLAVAAYVFVSAAGLVIGGRLGDRYGRRRTFLVAVAGFTLTSLLCALAADPMELIVARLGQGASAAAMIPQVLALIRAVFTDPARRARAIAGYGVAIGLGVVGGLAGGGVLVHVDLGGLGWRLAFLVMVPLGVLILLLGVRTLPESRSHRGNRIDLPGGALTLLCLPTLLVPLMFGPDTDWRPWTVAGLLLAAALVFQQRRAAARGYDPLFAPDILRIEGFLASLGTLVMFFAGNSGLFLIFTYYVQIGLGVDALLTGIMFVPLGVGFVAGSAASERLGVRYGMRVAVVGAAILAGSLVAAAAVVQLPVADQRPLLAAVVGAAGIGQALVVGPMVGSILGRVGADDAGAASGIATTTTQVGLASGFAATGVCYRTVLGAAPGDPAAPIGQAGHATAFAVTALALAGLAAVTSAMCWRMHRSTQNEPDPAASAITPVRHRRTPVTVQSEMRSEAHVHSFASRHEISRRPASYGRHRETGRHRFRPAARPRGGLHRRGAVGRP